MKPCEFCTRPTSNTGTGVCDECWPVYQRANTFARSRNGRARLFAAIANGARWEHGGNTAWDNQRAFRRLEGSN